jgi:hypothetical protein
MSTSDTDAEHELSSPTPAQWRQFETQVQKMLSALDPMASVEHDVSVPGDLSGTLRQVDVMIKGTVADQTITIAVECKRYARPLGIGAVDEFAGKLLDVGADRGVLFALNGLTDPAVRRARGAKVPRIEVGDFVEGPAHVEVNIDRLFTGLGDCPNDNCYTGDISWYRWRSDTGQMRSGACDNCGTWAAECPECGEIVDFFSNDADCGCGAVIRLGYDRKGVSVEEIDTQVGSVITVYNLDECAPAPHSREL